MYFIKLVDAVNGTWLPLLAFAWVDMHVRILNGILVHLSAPSGAPGSGGEVSYAERAVLAGRLAVSMWVTSKELITKVKSYSYVAHKNNGLDIGVDVLGLRFFYILTNYDLRLHTQAPGACAHAARG